MILLEVMFPVMFALIITGFVVAIIVWAGLNQKQARANWEAFAQKHGLKMTGGKGIGSRPQIQGWFGRVHVQLNTITRGSGKNRSTYTQYHATVNAPMPNGLMLTKEGFFSKIGKVFGGQDVQIGDRQIDEAFIIKAGDLKGAHDLLSNPHVKKALLYCIARHPGMRVQGNHVLVEQNGTAGKLPKIEGVFQDLAYLVETLDAAYQELVQRGGEVPAPQKPEPSKAAAAEILGDDIRNSGPKVQVQDTTEMKSALNEMGGALHQYANKVESGQERRTEQTSLQGSEESTNVNWKESFNVDAGDAFKNPDAGGAFDAPAPPESTDAAEERPPLEERVEGKADEPGTFGSFDEMLEHLSQSGLTSGDREETIKGHKGKSWEMEIEVDRVSSTFGFDLPDHLRDGKTVEGRLPSGDKVAVIFPKQKAAEAEGLNSGDKVRIWGTVAGWDDLFKKVTLHAE